MQKTTRFYIYFFQAYRLIEWQYMRRANKTSRLGIKRKKPEVTGCLQATIYTLEQEKEVKKNELQYKTVVQAGYTA